MARGFIQFPPRVVYGRVRLPPTTREWAHHRIREAGQRARQDMVRRHRADLLARADSTRRLRNVLRASSPVTAGASRGVDLLGKVNVLRPGRQRFQVSYKGPGTLGTMPNTSLVGRKVLAHVQQQKRRQARILPAGARRLGSCWRTAVGRMKAGWKAAHGSALLAGRGQEQQQMFDCIAGSRKGDYPKLWRKVPGKLRYRGVPGALAYLGVADVIEGNAVWRGELKPGAPLQIWHGKPGRLGHSAVFERYIRNKSGKVVGLVYSDQWLDYKVMVRRKSILAPHVIGGRFRQRKR